VHSLFQIILERMELESLFGMITGIAVMIYAGRNLGISLTWYDPFVFLVMVLGGAFVYAGIFVLLASISFWSDSRTSIIPMMYNIGNYGRYPVDIYNNVIRFVLTWILPFAFVGVYPAAYFLGREDWYVYAFLTPVVGGVFFAIALMVWNIGVTKYRGAGN
jgi:ABC-2 type transport system permease protein